MSRLAVLENGIFGMFLLAAAWQDFRAKAVERRVYLGFGTAAVVWNLAVMGSMLAGPGAGYGWGGVVRLLWGRAVSMLPGAGLLVLNRVSRGSIGKGDSWFFLVSGLLLDALRNLALLCCGVLLCGLYCLSYLVYRRFREQGNFDSGRRTVAFLPFVALAEAGMLIGRLAAG